MEKGERNKEGVYKDRVCVCGWGVNWWFFFLYCSCPKRVSLHVSLRQSHTLTVMSPEPVATVWPSGDTHTHIIALHHSMRVTLAKNPPLSFLLGVSFQGLQRRLTRWRPNLDSLVVRHACKPLVVWTHGDVCHLRRVLFKRLQGTNDGLVSVWVLLEQKHLPSVSVYFEGRINRISCRTHSSTKNLIV